MAHTTPGTTTADPPTGPRSLRETYHDPTTDENFLLANGVLTPADFADAMARPTKSAALLDALTDYASDYNYGDYAETVNRVLALLAEPGLRNDNLLAIAWGLPAGSGSDRNAEMKGALCTHPNATSDVLTTTLWSAGRATARAVAAATGIQLVAVIAWVRVRTLTSGYAGERTRAQIDATNARWTTWCGDDPGRAAFLLAASFDFACEETMFAAGAAILAPPAATQLT